jgi:putative oxidoreductase
MLQEFNGKYSNLIALFGRQLFSIIFILSSASHFKPTTVEYAAQHGVPLASVLVPLSGIIALTGGLSVLLGYQTRLGAWLLTLFLIPVTLTMHNFWAASDARAFQIESALLLSRAGFWSLHDPRFGRCLGGIGLRVDDNPDMSGR